jgi:hypothetical protein
VVDESLTLAARALPTADDETVMTHAAGGCEKGIVLQAKGLKRPL